MMPCYVDKPIWRLGRMHMCHLIADTLPELHAMAAAVGVAARHFQGRGFPHYDICKSKRAIAVSRGAKEVTRRELVEAMRRFRKNQPGRE